MLICIYMWFGPRSSNPESATASWNYNINMAITNTGFLRKTKVFPKDKDNFNFRGFNLPIHNTCFPNFYPLCSPCRAIFPCTSVVTNSIFLSSLISAAITAPWNSAISRGNFCLTFPGSVRYISAHPDGQRETWQNACQVSKAVHKNIHPQHQSFCKCRVCHFHTKWTLCFVSTLFNRLLK